jgi:hypothetical protein
MSTVNLGTEFADNVLAAAELDPQQHDANSLAIDYLPEAGAATVRVTRTASIDVAVLRQLIADAALPDRDDEA